jgi:hypothetical protein
MSRAISRRYRVRFAERGATDITASTVDFILEVPDMAAVPVVAGSFVHPLDGATEMRPLHVLGVDKAGGLIELFASGQRWLMIGRLVDLQYQLTADDPDTDPWTTYGTGRCSAIDELDGPGLFRVQISDESWVARKGDPFEVENTTQIWPSGVRGTWRGYPAAQMAWAEPIDQQGDLYRIRMWAGDTQGNLGPVAPPYTQGYEGREITPLIVNWIKRDMKEPDDRAVPGTSGGNWTHLRLAMLDDSAMFRDWEIVSFGSLGGNPFTASITQFLDNPEILFAGTIGQTWRIYLWVRSPSSGIVPYAAGLSSAWLYAPTAPPDRELPLHLGIELNTQHDIATHEYGTIGPLSSGAPGSGGFLHVADATRRLWDALDVRYDPQNLYDLEQDTSFPLLAPRLFEIPDDPEKVFQARAWGPLLIVALKDVFGRRKLKDIRPPPANTDLSALTVLDVSNSKLHRWKVEGREQVNSINWLFHRITIPGEPKEGPGRYAVQVLNFPEQAHTLDWFITEELEYPPYASYDADLIGRRPRDFDVQWLLADPNSRPSQKLAALQSDLGQPFLEPIVTQYSDFLLGVYQDGPMYGRCEVGGSTAETLEEGDYVVVDCTQVKIANPFTAARFAKVLVLVLSVTRYPAHAEVEYLIIRDALFFLCPDPLDETTWLLSPFDQVTTVIVSMVAPEPESGELFSFKIRARKNAAGGDSINMQIAFVVGGLVVSSWAETDVSATFTDYIFTLDATEQAIISDWTDIQLWITRNGTIDSDPSNWRRLEISEVEAV